MSEMGRKRTLALRLNKSLLSNGVPFALNVPNRRKAAVTL